MTMQSAFVDPDKKVKLRASFDVIAAWAEDADHEKYADVDLQKLAQDAKALSDISKAHNPAEAMRRAADLVRSMDRMIDLRKSFKSMPGDDPDRTNTQLRTALRRVEKVRNDDVWHIQLT